MPKATKQVVWRIVFFYVISLLCVGFIVPYTNPDLLGGASAVDTSPFVITADLAGIHGFGNFMNFIIFISTLSVGNSSVFGASRTLLAIVEMKQVIRQDYRMKSCRVLALKGLFLSFIVWSVQGPEWLGYVDRAGRPLVSLVMSLLFGLIAYVNTDPVQSAKCFLWLLAISGLSALFTWLSICVAHIRFRAAWAKAGHTVEELPFTAQFGVTGSIIGALINFLALVACFYTSLFPTFGYPAPAHDDLTLSSYYFFSNYLAFPVIVAFALFWLFYSRITSPEGGWGWLSIDSIDLHTGIGKIPSLDELREERAKIAEKPWYVRWYIAVFD